MDGEAVSTAFATVPEPHCIREVVPKLGYCLKVYRCLKALLEETQVFKRAQNLNEVAILNLSELAYN